MPNRILRDWTTSETVDKLTAEQETAFTRLLMAVDDFGRYDADPRLLAARLYPLRICGTSAKHMHSMRDALVRHGLVMVYKAEGKEFLQIVKWENIPRAKHSKFPACTADAQQMHSICTTSAPVTVTGTDTGTENREPETESCAEPGIPASAPESSPVVLWFDCTGGSQKWPLTEKQAEEWQELFPSIDVLSECSHARAWENANPSKRKTFTGKSRFLLSWLKRQQDSGKGRRVAPGQSIEDDDSKPF